MSESLNIDLGAARKVVGQRQVLRALEAGELSLVIIAADADARLRDSLIAAAGAAGTDHRIAAGRSELGSLCGIDVSAACVGIFK